MSSAARSSPRTPELHERLVWWANCTGVTGAPFDSYLTLRGLRTLHARLRVHGENAALVSHLLAGHPAVRHVYYPGLRSHPQHELARSQQSGFGGMLSFELHGGIGNVRAFLTGCNASRSPSRSAASRAWSRILRA